MLDPTACSDSFARDNLPPAEFWPVFENAAPDPVIYPKRFNAAAELLDQAVAGGHGARPCLRSPHGIWSYAETLERANRIASFLVRDLGLESGNRVLLRAPNNPILAACWLAVLKAGGIAVQTMPLLRSRELAYILRKAKVQFALCDVRLKDELAQAAAEFPALKTVYLNTDSSDGLDARTARQSDGFSNVTASHDDVALIAFTSGTTGSAKATMHFHRDILAIADNFPRAVLDPAPEDVFGGSAPFAFTFGLGALLVFPLRFGASSILLEQSDPESLLGAIAAHRVTTLFTVPTLYRAMLPLVSREAVSSLRTCVSSGEHLPPSVFDAWRNTTGISLINSMGSTEMLHAFLAMPKDDIRRQAVGRPLPAYRAMIVDEDMNPVPPNVVGRLAVRGPTGCRYLDDIERQQKYVRNGWNLTGDAFTCDDDGFFRYHARTDDMIISSGYNISGAEIEEVLLRHPGVKECAVVGRADSARGQIVTAFIVPHDPEAAGQDMTRALQELVKSSIAPYKYPHAIEYVDALPKTDSGKIQRNVLRERPL